MRIDQAAEKDLDELVPLRALLWPDDPDADHRADGLRALRRPESVVFLARDPQGHVIGFSEATIRRDYVNGCTGSPVAFLEAIYVREEQRGKGIARALVTTVEGWARTWGLGEIASDALLANSGSHLMHQALGFSETERVVYFRKSLD